MRPTCIGLILRLPRATQIGPMTNQVLSAGLAQSLVDAHTTLGQCMAQQQSLTPTSKWVRLTAHMGTTQPPQPPHPLATTPRPPRDRNPSPPSHRSPQLPGPGMWEQNVAQHFFLGITLARCATQVLLCQATTGVLSQKIIVGTAAAHGARTVHNRHTASTKTRKDPPAACLPPILFQSADLQESELSSCSQGSLQLLGSAPGECVDQRATSTSSQTLSLRQRYQCSQKPWLLRLHNSVCILNPCGFRIEKAYDLT